MVNPCPLPTQNHVLNAVEEPALRYRWSDAAYFFLGKAYLELGRVDLARAALKRSHEMGYSRASAELRRIDRQ